MPKFWGPSPVCGVQKATNWHFFLPSSLSNQLKKIIKNTIRFCIKTNMLINGNKSEPTCTAKIHKDTMAILSNQSFVFSKKSVETIVY